MTTHTESLLGGLVINPQFVELVGWGLVRTSPKSRAGTRTVSVPAAIRVDHLQHMRDHVRTGPSALVPTG